MTVLSQTLPHVVLGLPKIAGSLIGRIGGFCASIRAGQQVTRDFDKLNRMTDSQLGARGLVRSDVARLVFQKYFV